MSAKNPFGIHIPAVFVGYNTGMALKNNYQYDSDFFVIITADDSSNINTQLLIPFAVVVGICFLIMLIFMVRINYKCKYLVENTNILFLFRRL